VSQHNSDFLVQSDFGDILTLVSEDQNFDIHQLNLLACSANF